MGIETLVPEKTEATKMVAVKLPESIVTKLQGIRKETGKTNSEVYAALIGEGLKAYQSATGKRPRGRPRKIKGKAAKAKA